MSHFITLGAAVLLALTGCSTTKTGDRADGIKTVAPEESRGVAVWLIPMDDFRYEEAALLAKALSDDLKLNVRATLNMGSAGLKPFAGTTQFAAEDIFAMANAIIPNLTDKRPDTAYIVLTQRDINSRERSLRFNFAVHNRAMRTAVLSSARLTINQAGGMVDVPTIRKRLFKMTKRNIGDVYYGYTRSTDIRDVMYSPIMGLDDIDRMGTEFFGR
jgi:predicted Zn-dependent protease